MLRWLSKGFQASQVCATAFLTRTDMLVLHPFERSYSQSPCLFPVRPRRPESALSCNMSTVPNENVCCSYFFISVFVSFVSNSVAYTTIHHNKNKLTESKTKLQHMQFRPLSLRGHVTKASLTMNCQKLTKHIKMILYSRSWRAYSCPPTWQPKLLFA